MYDTLGEYDSQEIAQDCYNRFSPSVISDKLVDVFQKAVEKKKKCHEESYNYCRRWYGSYFI